MSTERILLLRHAEGEHNLLEMVQPLSAEDFQNRMDNNQAAQLTDKGLAQAEEAAEALLHEGISKVFISLFHRTAATAQPFLEKTGMAAEVLPEISEILPHPLPDELLGQNPELPAFLYYGLGFARKLFKPGAPVLPETVMGSWQRAAAALWRLGQEDGTILAISHGGMIAAITGQAVLSGAWKVERFTLENAGISELVRR